LTDRWSFYSLDLPKHGLLGYRLGDHGGNFVEVAQDGVHVQWSFYQDFDIKQDLAQGVLLTNDPAMPGTKLAPDVIGLSVPDHAMKLHSMDWRPALQRELDPAEAVHQIRQRLSENLVHCLDQAQAPHRIVFTGGLDSGVLAFMALHQGREFQCVVNTQHRQIWTDLPFPQIIYRDSSVPIGADPCVRESYYDADMTDCVTGFFGDTALMHNRTLYDQCRDLGAPPVDLYDRAAPDPAPRFRNQFQARQASINIMRTTRFRQWFPDFRILDPYRDPDITQLVLSLPWNELCSQFGSAWIQREIIQSFDPGWSRFLLKHKNEYPG
jgi:hypothetical protein